MSEETKRAGRFLKSAFKGILPENHNSKGSRESGRFASTNHRLKQNNDEESTCDKKKDFDLSIHKNTPKSLKNECTLQHQRETAANFSRSRPLSGEGFAASHVRNVPETKCSELNPNFPQSSTNKQAYGFRSTGSSRADCEHYNVNPNETGLMHDRRIRKYNSFQAGSPSDWSLTYSKSNDLSTANKYPAYEKIKKIQSNCGQNTSSQRVQKTNERSYSHKKYKSKRDDYGQYALHSDFKKNTSEDELYNDTITLESENVSERHVSDSDSYIRLNNNSASKPSVILKPSVQVTIANSNSLQKKGIDSFNSKCELSNKNGNKTDSVVVHDPKNVTNNSNVLSKDGNAYLSNISDEGALSTVDEKIHSAGSHAKWDDSDNKVYNFIRPVDNPITEFKSIQGIITNEINESEQHLCLQYDSVSQSTAHDDKKMVSNEKKAVSKTLKDEVEFCPNMLPEQYEAITKYILQIEEKRKADCQLAERVIYDLTRFFNYYFPGTFVDYYGSYRSGLAISSSNINISLNANVTVRNSILQEIHKSLSKELSANPKYLMLPFEDKTHVKLTKILFIEQYTSVECEMAYLGKSEKNLYNMAELLKMLSKFDVRVKSLFIAARIWAEVCAIDEVEDGKLPAIAFPLLVIYFLQRCQKPILPVLKIEEFTIMQKRLKACPKVTTASVGELWFEFLKYYAVTFNWDETIVSITNLELVPKSSKHLEKVWICIEDPFSGENIAKSVINLDTANFIRACFDAFYNHMPSPCGSYSDSNQGAIKWTYSFDSCNAYEYAPPECEDCAVLGTATCRSCLRKEYVPLASPLPDLSDDSLLLKTADKVLHDVYNEYILNESAINGRKAFVEDLERYIQQRFKGAKLSLFGSSVNGFGFNKSDLDINLTFSGNEEKERSQQVLILKQVMKHLRKNENYKDVFFLPAQIPIVKFCFIRNGWCGDISFGNSLAVHNSELLHAYSTIDERCRILGCALKLITKKTRLASTVDKALSSYAYIIMVVYYLQQVHPPVLPVLQDYKLCAQKLEVPNEIVETWNTWFIRGDKETYAAILFKQSGQPRNTKTAAQLWIGLLNFYVNFNYDHVISIRQREILPVEEKQRTYDSFNIEDPFILSKNLGSVLSSGKAKELQAVLGRARQIFGNEKSFPKKMDNYKNYFFSASHLTGRTEKEMECNICGEFDHNADQCQRLHRNYRFRKYRTFNYYTKFLR